jgi:hypothetical protein
VYKLATTCNPPYPAPDLLEKYKESIHHELSKHITLVYVFDGIATALKDGIRASHCKGRDEIGAKWLALRQCALNGETVLTKDEIAEAHESRMKMKKPTPADHAKYSNGCLIKRLSVLVPWRKLICTWSNWKKIWYC